MSGGVTGGDGAFRAGPFGGRRDVVAVIMRPLQGKEREPLLVQVPHSLLSKPKVTQGINCFPIINTRSERLSYFDYVLNLTSHTLCRRAPKAEVPQLLS